MSGEAKAKQKRSSEVVPGVKARRRRMRLRRVRSLVYKNGRKTPYFFCSYWRRSFRATGEKICRLCNAIYMLYIMRRTIRIIFENPDGYPLLSTRDIIKMTRITENQLNPRNRSARARTRIAGERDNVSRKSRKLRATPRP